MSHIRPILSDDPSESERALFESARLDIAPPGGKERMLAALGLQVAAAAAGATKAAAAPAATPAVSSVTSTVVGKWLTIGALAGTVVAGTVDQVSHVSRPPASAPDGARAEAGRATPITALPVPGGDQPERIEQSAEGRTEPPSVAAVGRPVRREVDESFGGSHVAPSVPHAPASDRMPDVVSATVAVAPSGAPPDAARPLSEEVQSLDVVRRTLSRQGGASALGALDAHAAAFPRPRLAPEATLLRIEILIALGRSADARRVGEAFLRDDPRSPHTQRVRSLIGSPWGER